MGRRREDRELHWRGVLKRQAESGLSGAQFCRQESLSAPSFYAWKRKLRDRDQAATDVESARGSRPAAAEFLPVRIESATPTRAVRILLPGGVSVETASDVDETGLTKLLRAVCGAELC